jgi:tRNA-modifying protein YgfZ
VLVDPTHMPPLPTEELVVIRVAGADARTFLQGQLTCDVRKAVRDKAVWGAFCTGQGRVQGIVTVAPYGDDLLCLLPLELAEGALSRLQRFTLSSKVTFERLPWVPVPVTAAEARELVGDLLGEPGDCRSAGSRLFVRWWGSPARYLCLDSRELGTGFDDADRSSRWRGFHRADLEAGLPRVFHETLGLFVPQTLNLDLLGGISFEKGCYVGQEVVARARRGGVHRRMFGFSARGPVPPPGTVVMRAGEEVGHVVDAIGRGDGCDLLAVVDLAPATDPPALHGYAGSELIARALPYAVPLERR